MKKFLMLMMFGFIALSAFGQRVQSQYATTDSLAESTNDTLVITEPVLWNGPVEIAILATNISGTTAATYAIDVATEAAKTSWIQLVAPTALTAGTAKFITYNELPYTRYRIRVQQDATVQYTHYTYAFWHKTKL